MYLASKYYLISCWNEIFEKMKNGKVKKIIFICRLPDD